MGDYRKLTVWQKATDLSVTVYQLSDRLPSSERYELSLQMRRAVVSIAAKIAEGCGRNTAPQLRQFLRVASGSASELECYLILAPKLGLLRNNDVATAIDGVDTVKRMLTGLIDSLDG